MRFDYSLKLIYLPFTWRCIFILRFNHLKTLAQKVYQFFKIILKQALHDSQNTYNSVYNIVVTK